MNSCNNGNTAVIIGKDMYVSPFKSVIPVLDSYGFEKGSFEVPFSLDIYTYYVANLKDSVESKKSDPFYLNGLGENYDCKFINAPYREMVQRMLTHNPHRGSLDSLYKLIELTASQFNWNKGASDDKS